jgi:hypothetical protein
MRVVFLNVRLGFSNGFISRSRWECINEISNEINAFDDSIKENLYIIVFLSYRICDIKQNI